MTAHLQLWALLHFIMPTLFDSHKEFDEWFSKDIESHAQDNTAIDHSSLLVVRSCCFFLFCFVFICMLIISYLLSSFLPLPCF